MKPELKKAILNALFKEGKQECTCRIDQKQRALCPVCDKDKFEARKELQEDLIRKKSTLIENKDVGQFFKSIKGDI